MAKRFDRFVANPETVALPQCYDEFLDRELLRCPVEGCDWEGKSLSCHVNFTHGITAEKFKEQAGFNRKTGLVSKDLSKLLSERAGKYLHLLGTQFRQGPMPDWKPPPLRLEGKEHVQKAAAMKIGVPVIVDAETKERLRRISSETVKRTHASIKEKGLPAKCDVCGKDFMKHTHGRARFCSRDCYRVAYRKRWTCNKSWEMECGFCGRLFFGAYGQHKSRSAGKTVYCSRECVNSKRSLIRC